MEDYDFEEELSFLDDVQMYEEKTELEDFQEPINNSYNHSGSNQDENRRFNDSRQNESMNQKTNGRSNNPNNERLNDREQEEYYQRNQKFNNQREESFNNQREEGFNNQRNVNYGVTKVNPKQAAEASKLKSLRLKETIIRLIIESWKPELTPSNSLDAKMKAIMDKENIIKSILHNWKI